jgi:putative ABC transport system substrate-binding protein
VRRRDFIKAIAGSAAAWPFGAQAQPPARVRRIGFLAGGARPPSLDNSIYSNFLRGMRELGYGEGRDFVMEWRFAEGRFELFPSLAGELVRLNVDVIVLGSSSAVAPTKQATSMIPIVMASAFDPVGNGFVASLARPGGNVTGLATSQEDTAPKRLELLSMTAPTVTRVGFLINPDNNLHSAQLKTMQGAARNTDLVVVSAEMQRPEDVAGSFARLSDERVGALVIPADAFFFTQRQRIADFALRARLPTMFTAREYVEAGGLMNYGEALGDFYRRAAVYVDRIFRGAKPADLPVEQPTRFFLTVNRKTAEAIGVSIPLQVLVRADEVIE